MPQLYQKCSKCNGTRPTLVIDGLAAKHECVCGFTDTPGFEEYSWTTEVIEGYQKELIEAGGRIYELEADIANDLRGDAGRMKFAALEKEIAGLKEEAGDFDMRITAVVDQSDKIAEDRDVLLAAVAKWRVDRVKRKDEADGDLAQMIDDRSKEAGRARLRLAVRANYRAAKAEADSDLVAVDPPAAVEAKSTCDHGLKFDSVAAKNMTSQQVVAVFPRLFGPCPKGCGFDGIGYASMEHYISGDW